MIDKVLVCCTITMLFDIDLRQNIYFDASMSKHFDAYRVDRGPWDNVI